MTAHVVDLVDVALTDRGLTLESAKVGVVGVTAKPNVRDTRNAPARQIVASLAARRGRVTYHDPHVASFEDAAGAAYSSTGLDELLSVSDVIGALVGHASVDWELLYRRAALVDAVNSSHGRNASARQVLRLQSGWSGS